MGSEVAETCTESIEGALIGILHRSEVREAGFIRRRHRTEPIEAIGISRWHRSEAREATEWRHRHHSEAAGKRSRHRAEIGVLHAVSVEAGIYDFDRHFGFGRDGLGFRFTGFTRGLAPGAPFGGREFDRGVFRFQNSFVCACLSREELYGPQNTDGQYGQEESDISRNRDQRISCLCNSNGVCRDILDSLLTASVYLCSDSLASASNNVAANANIV